MAQAEVVAVAGAPARRQHHPVHGRQHRRTFGAGQVHPPVEVCLPCFRAVFGQGVLPPAVPRGEAPAACPQREHKGRLRDQRVQAASLRGRRPGAGPQGQPHPRTQEQPAHKGCQALVFVPGSPWAGCPFGSDLPVFLCPSRLHGTSPSSGNILCAGRGAVCLGRYLPRRPNRLRRSRANRPLGSSFTTRTVSAGRCTGAAGSFARGAGSWTGAGAGCGTGAGWGAGSAGAWGAGASCGAACTGRGVSGRGCGSAAGAAGTAAAGAPA